MKKETLDWWKEILFKTAYWIIDNAYTTYYEMLKMLEEQKELSEYMLSDIKQQISYIRLQIKSFEEIYLETHITDFLGVIDLLSELDDALSNHKRMSKETENLIEALISEHNKMIREGKKVSYTKLFSQFFSPSWLI